MDIISVASEAKPFCKTGGLADVVYSLSKELVKLKENVSIFIPYYLSMKKANIKNVELVDTFLVPQSWRRGEAKIYKTVYEGINYYFVSNEQYFDRDHLYGDFDDGERFAFFSIAVKMFILKNKLACDIMHIHDWQAGMLPCMMKEDSDLPARYRKTKYVMTIHNPAFQGLMPKIILGDLYNLSDNLYDNGNVRFKDQVSTLKAGLVYADKITTVSPTHRLELLSPEGGMGLDGVLRLREYDFEGILNGIDTNEYNPEMDKEIYTNYSLTNFISGKKANKTELFKYFNIKDYGKPLFSLVTRITWQKGFDLLLPTLEELLENGCNVVVLGSGEYQYEQRLEDLRTKYPDKLGIYIGYNESLAHKIYASSDYFLMPSLFEPCGLGQMIAERYGALPIVRRTGGLKDSVVCFDGNNLETANGFGFDEYSAYALRNTTMYALSFFNKKETIKKLKQNALKTDNSWKRSALEYQRVYKSLID